MHCLLVARGAFSSSKCECIERISHEYPLYLLQGQALSFKNLGKGFRQPTEARLARIGRPKIASRSISSKKDLISETRMREFYLQVLASVLAIFGAVYSAWVLRVDIAGETPAFVEGN
jgi:hypothetical protein